MGIKGFYGQWVKKLPSNMKNKINGKTLPTIIASLFIDMNSMFHKAASEVFLYSQKAKRMNVKEKEKQLEILRQKTEDEKTYLVAKRVCEMIYEKVSKFKPSEYLVLAVDGVAPMAKITQQRKRRFKKAKDEGVPLEDVIDPEDEHSPSNSIFDSNCITPGTRFMQLMDFYIQKFINDNMKLRTNLFPPNIIYSSHLTPGEGEHKIFEMIRAGQIKPETVGANVLLGEDADLIMLSLLSNLPYIYLYREGEYDSATVNIDALREYIHEQLNLGSDEAHKIPIETTTRDFVVMVFLEGNDFLPKIMAFDEIGTTINAMIDIYIALSLPLTQEDGSIYWKNLEKFMKYLADNEETFLKQIAKKKFYKPFAALEKATKVERLAIDEGTFGLTGQEKEKVVLNYPLFQELWYENALSPFTEKGRKFMKQEKLEGYPFTQNGVMNMGYQYMIGIQWVLRYYQYGTKGVSSRFLYTYHHAPLLKDLALIMTHIESLQKSPSFEDVKFSPEDPKITPIHQLIAVMPPASWKFIPEKFRNLMPTRFADLSPKDFKIEYDGIAEKKDDWIAIPLLSIVDPVRISRDLEDMDIPKEYHDRLAYFIKNIRKVFVPNVPINLEHLEKMKQREAEKVERMYKARPVLASGLSLMKQEAEKVKVQRNEFNQRVEDKEFQRKNLFIWERQPLM